MWLFLASLPTTFLKTYTSPLCQKGFKESQTQIVRNANIFVPHPNLIWQEVKNFPSSFAEQTPEVVGRAGQFHGLTQAL